MFVSIRSTPLTVSSLLSLMRVARDSVQSIILHFLKSDAFYSVFSQFRAIVLIFMYINTPPACMTTRKNSLRSSVIMPMPPKWEH